MPTPTLSVAERCAQEPPDVIAQPLRRLSRSQYLNTMDTLVRRVVPESSGADWYAGQMALDVLYLFPPDRLIGGGGGHRGGFRRLDQTLYQEHIEASVELAMIFADTFARTYWLDGVAGCSLRHEQGTCVPQLIATLGGLIHRRPLSDEDSAFYLESFTLGSAAYTQSPEDTRTPEAFALDMGLRDLLAVMLASPDFLYHVESGQTEEAGIIAPLDAYELANRLSFHIWQGMPDDALFAAAADGSLLTDAGFEAQARRLMGDPRSHESIEAFYREWLRSDEVPEMNRLRGTDVYDAFADGFYPSADLNDAMMAEIGALGVYHTLESPTDLDGFIRSRVHLTQSSELASLYGQSPWDGIGQPPMLSDPARVGILTRGALLATGSANTRPIMKGVLAYEALLCGSIGAPPDNAAAFPPEPSAELTTRQVVELLTEQEGSNCQGCHEYLINPYGFATENFDALGRTREVQRLFDDEGTQVGEVPVNTADTVYLTGDAIVSQGAQDLTDLMLSTEDVHRCFAQHYLRYTFGRPEDRGADLCALDDLSARLLRGDTLDEVLLSLALRPEFKLRSFLDEEVD